MSAPRSGPAARRVGRRARELDRRAEQPCPAPPTIPRARTSSDASASSRPSTGSRQQSCSSLKASHSARVRSANTASTSRWVSEPTASNWRVDEVGPAGALAPGAPELRLQRAERHPAVGAAVRAVADRARPRAACAPRSGAAPPASRRAASIASHDSAPSVIETSTSWPSPERVALAQRREDAERGHQRAAAEVGDLAGRLDGRPVRVAGQAEQPDPRQVVRVVPGPRGERPVLPVAGDRAVDEPRVLLAQALVADPEAVHDAGPERLEHHVGVAGQAQERVAPPRVLEVDADRRACRG